MQSAVENLRSGVHHHSQHADACYHIQQQTRTSHLHQTSNYEKQLHIELHFATQRRLHSHPRPCAQTVNLYVLTRMRSFLGRGAQVLYHRVLKSVRVCFGGPKNSYPSKICLYILTPSLIPIVCVITMLWTNYRKHMFLKTPHES